MKKVLVLASTFPRWQNDTTPPFVLELEKRLAKNFEIHVLAPHHKGAKKHEVMEKLTVHRFQYFWPAKYQGLCYEGGILPNLKRNKLLYFQALTLLFFELIAAAKLIKKQKINLIHAHWIIPQGIIAYIINKVFHTPYIVTTHGGDIYGLQNKLLVKLKKNILENAKAVTVVSTAIKDEIHKKINPKLKVEVISMGVDSKLFNPNKYDESIKKKYKIQGPFLLFVGRLAEKKGVKYLLEAMPDIIKTFPKITLLIVGDGTLKEELIKLSKKLNIDKQTFFTGPVANHSLPKYYATADIIVSPSITTDDGDTEGLPVVALESIASGSILIATKTGGYIDVIQSNRNGILINQKNSSEIRDAIFDLLNNENKINRIKQNSIELVKQFDWEQITSKYNLLAYKSA